MSVSAIVGAGASYANGNSHVLIIPDTILQPGDHVEWSLLNADAGDVVNLTNYLLHVIPTGPTPQPSTPPAVAVGVT